MIWMSQKLAALQHAIAASKHKRVKTGVGLLFDRPVQALEVFFDQKLHAG
jgi:hypothetical protein